jgi:signal transduction histidine kinase
MDSSLRELAPGGAASNTARWEVARLRRPARVATLEVERMRFEGVVRFVLWPAVLVAGAVTAALILTSDTVDRPLGTAALTLLVGLTWAITGMLEWRRNPTNLIGVLMMGCALAWFLGRLTFTDYALPYTIGILTSPLFFAVFGHVLLAFPYGRLQSRLSRGVVTVGYLDTTVVIAAAVVLFPGDVGYPENLALVHANAGLSDALRNTARGVGISCFIVVLAILAHRWRNATPRWRRTFALVFWTGAAASALSAVAIFTRAPYRPLGPVEIVAYLVIAAVPLAMTMDLLRGKFERGAVADLVLELGDTRAPGKLRDALARALHDPSLSLAYWLPERDGYFDVEGRPVELPGEGGPKTATVVEREGRPVAALVHDSALADEQHLVGAVGAAAGLALENERLQADLRARLAELRASRARMVDAADAERRRLERNLHDGTQQRLVSISMALGLAESKLDSDPSAAGQILDEARQALGAALQELREFSQGIHPAILTERGLGPALQELVYLAPMSIVLDVPDGKRLPEPVESAAYYVVAEALANVAKYASAATVSVKVERRNGHALIEIADDGVGGADPAKGSGLRGLSDRVEALGGTLAVDSTPGLGTRLRADIPCAL